MGFLSIGIFSFISKSFSSFVDGVTTLKVRERDHKYLYEIFSGIKSYGTFFGFLAFFIRFLRYLIASFIIEKASKISFTKKFFFIQFFWNFWNEWGLVRTYPSIIEQKKGTQGKPTLKVCSLTRRHHVLDRLSSFILRETEVIPTKAFLRK